MLFLQISHCPMANIPGEDAISIDGSGDGSVVLAESTEIDTVEVSRSRSQHIDDFGI